MVMHMEDLPNYIELCGFSEIDQNSMTTVRRMVGNYARKLEDHCEQFERLKLTLKNIHKSDDHPGRFELHGKLIDNGKSYASEAIDQDLFISLNLAMKKLEASISR